MRQFLCPVIATFVTGNSAATERGSWSQRAPGAFTMWWIHLTLLCKLLGQVGGHFKIIFLKPLKIRVGLMGWKAPR